MSDLQDFNPYAPTHKQTNTLRCPRCGAIPQGRFCQNCGLDIQTFKYSKHKQKKKNTLGKAIFTILVLFSTFFLSIVGIGVVMEFQDSKNKGQQGVENVKQQIEGQTDVNKNPQIGDIDYYKNSCETFDYVSIARNPEEYINKRVKTTCKISQDLGLGMYVAYTQDSNGYFYGDEIVIRDKREDSSLHIIENDIIEVYGEFAGTVELTRVMTNTDDSILSINGRIIDIKANSTQSYIDELNTEAFNISTTGSTEGQSAIGDDREIVYANNSVTIYCYYPTVKDGDYEIKIEVENHSDLDFKLSFPDISVNDYQFTGGSADANSGNKAVDTINIYKYKLEDCGIEQIDTIKIPMSVRWVTDDNGLMYSYYETSNFEVAITSTN